MNPVIETCKVGDVEIKIETGRVAKQANSVLITIGETTVLTTAVSSAEPRDLPFLPLTVEYREAGSAAGKIPGGYFKREGRPGENEILTCRVTDRPIRPLFPKGYRNDTQIISNVLSHDKENEPDVLSTTGASAALTISEIPWAGPIAGIRVARIDGKFVAFPTYSQTQKADITLVVGVSRDAIVMVEGGAQQVSESDMIDALMFAKDSAAPLIELQDRLRERVGKEKRIFVPPAVDDELIAAVKDFARGGMVEAIKIHGKHDRHDAIKELKKASLAKFADSHPEGESDIKSAIGALEKEVVRTQVVETGVRIDGRDTTTVRPLHIEAHPFPRPHGSALFQRGETQAIVSVTLGTEYDAQRLDTIRGDVRRNFLLHYNFPPYCTGEARPMRGTSRREIGHGALAERSLKVVMPDTETFPYTVRIVSDVTESNGSSSMASVCGGSLALMDAGVPIKAPVAGIAMGLIQEGDKIAVLTDILGDEDHMGDMDFKVTGTADGITALQMDIKVQGLTRKILEDALSQARDARLHILDGMNETLAQARDDVSQYAPRIVTMQVKVDRIRDIIGPGGKMIRAITEQSGAQINVDDSGRVSISSSSIESIDKARRLIEGLTAEAEIGAYYQGMVTRCADFGAFVEILPGTDGLVHISELENHRVNQVTDVLNEGDEVVVKVLNIDQTGRIRLSRKAAFGVDPSEVQNMRA
ncbi:MAG: polyribonucleotide nucleotidyltransferase [Deltaproteobacteria bacterium]|nr:polyribonucleotide nucleotidyltransferase [Deltaproteobacteria bacterium]